MVGAYCAWLSLGKWAMAATMSLRLTLLTLCVLALATLAGCKKETPLDLYVDGFLPQNVRFEVEDLGLVDDAQLAALKRRPDIDGVALLPPSACAGPCRAAIFSVFVHNKSGQPEATPVVRLDVPLGKPPRQPIAFGGGEITQGRIGRIRWLVSLYPEETGLTATLSSSVFIVNDPVKPAPPAVPAPDAPIVPAPQGTP
jgi:hypothetical protein